MTFMDRLRASATAFFSPPEVAQGRPSLSSQRHRDQIGRAYLGASVGRRLANDDPLLTVHGGGDLALWKDILDDERCFSCFQQRQLAVVSRPWEVEAGGSDRKSKKAADFLRHTINQVGWDRVCRLMLYSVWYGYGVAEAVYRIEPEGDWSGLIGLERIDVPDRGWFGFGRDGELRIIDPLGVRDEQVPDRKFWTIATGGDHDFVPYGVGLAHWLFWPVFFKRQGLPFWLKFLERFGSPTVKGDVSAGQLDTEAGRNKVLQVLNDITGNGAVAVPDWMKVDLLDAARSGPGGYELLLDRMDAAITRVILSQTMTTDDGSSRSQAEVHMDVREEITRSDSDLLHESFNRSIAVWLTDFNFPGAKPPRVYRIMDDPDDLDTLAKRDLSLKELGWERDETSFREVYGEGYVKREVVKPPPGQVDPNSGEPAQFAAEDIDAIDRLVSAMAADTDSALTEFLAPLKGKFEGVTNPEIARIAMLDFLETVDREKLHEVLAKPMFAVRSAAEAGVDPELLA
jgi:phage gp29-like protein